MTHTGNSQTEIQGIDRDGKWVKKMQVPEGGIFNGVVIGVLPPNDKTGYKYDYETVGTKTEGTNLRLRSHGVVCMHPRNAQEATLLLDSDGKWTASTRELKTNIHDFAIHEAIESRI